MFEILAWLAFIIFMGALIVAGGLLLRGYMTGSSPTAALTGALFRPRPEKRIDVVEQLNVDGRRRLLIIRRDDVEHLIMTGGPVDVVIETGIGEKVEPKRRALNGEAGVTTMTPRTARVLAPTTPTSGEG